MEDRWRWENELHERTARFVQMYLREGELIYWNVMRHGTVLAMLLASDWTPARARRWQQLLENVFPLEESDPPFETIIVSLEDEEPVDTRITRRSGRGRERKDRVK